MTMSESHEYREGANEKTNEKKLIVEIGPGLIPAYRNIAVSENDYYFSVEKNKNRAKSLQGSKKIKNFQSLVGDARNLMFKDESVNEVIINNVFGDPSIRTQHKIAMLGEVSRVLKKGGKVFITEVYTPEFSDIHVLEPQFKKLNLDILETTNKVALTRASFHDFKITLVKK